MPTRIAQWNSATKGDSLRSSSNGVLWLPFTLIVLFGSFPIFVPRAAENPHIPESFWAAGVALLLLFLMLVGQVIRSGRVLCYQIVLNKVHYVQLMMHTCVYAYWGWYWREVYDYIPLLIGQILFAYVLDMLVCWWRRDKWILGFGPFPIVLSTSLFLWFRDDWFYLQFLMIATGVAGKEFIKWRREGRLTHIFNPSALSLFVFSIGLIATKSTDRTWGIQIADTLHRPPHIYLEIFLLGLVVQALFGVTLVTLWSAFTLYVLNLLYTGITGDYNFIDSNIPVAVFLGLHLLVTDPSTSPRRSFGKIIFGAMYGAGVFGMYRLLTSIGAPEFYDKLLCVPILNLSVRGLDRVSELLNSKVRVLGWPSILGPKRTNLAWMSVWGTLFIVMMTTGFLSKGKDHPGGNPEYWRRACFEGQRKACTIWVRTLNVTCQGASARGCFTLGQVLQEGHLVPRNAEMAGVAFGRACDSGNSEGCSKLIEFVQADGKDVLLRACHRDDGASCFVLGSLYSGGSGIPQDASLAFDLFRRSCDIGWWRGCGRLAVSYLVGQGTAVDPSKAIENFEKACRAENAPSCFEVGKLYHSGVGGVKDDARARERLDQACQLGLQAACRQENMAGGAARP